MVCGRNEGGNELGLIISYCRISISSFDVDMVKSAHRKTLTSLSFDKPNYFEKSMLCDSHQHLPFAIMGGGDDDCNLVWWSRTGTSVLKIAQVILNCLSRPENLSVAVLVCNLPVFYWFSLVYLFVHSQFLPEKAQENLSTNPDGLATRNWSMTVQLQHSGSVIKRLAMPMDCIGFESQYLLSQCVSKIASGV
ncbi:hypothetical protein AMTRI_Chr08g161820 [Amborella trichopoda]